VQDEEMPILKKKHIQEFLNMKDFPTWTRHSGKAEE